MHPVKTYLLWLAVALCSALHVSGTVVADVIVLNNGQRIETPKALVEGTQVYFYKDEAVQSIPHSQVREIQRSTAEVLPAPESDAAPPSQFYRLVFIDGRTTDISDYNDTGKAIQYTKYDVRVTMEKSVIQTITRISKNGEQVVFRHGQRPKSLPAKQRQEGEAALRRMSQESRERALYNAIVDEKAINAEADKKQRQGSKRCMDQCLKTMLVCRDNCAEVLDTLKSRQVPESDPAYKMVHDEVVTPCIRKCIATESACRKDCNKAP